MNDKVVIGGEISLISLIDGAIELTITVDGISGTAYEVEKEMHQKYHGDYTIIPTVEEQILETKNKLMIDNVTINPIPSNYGLVTWNGSYLIIS